MIYRILTASSLTLGLLAILSACSSESELRFSDGFIQDHDFSVELNSAGDGLDISFTPQSDASYQLTRSSEFDCSSDTCADYLALTINDEGTATDSLPADTYYYKLTVSLSGISEKFSAQYPPAGILPEDFTATAGNGQVTLSWTPYSDDTTYNIYRSSDPDCDLTNYTSCANNALFTSKSSGFVDDGLSNGTTYYYWIEAVVDGVTYLGGSSVSAIPSGDEGSNINLTDGLVAHYEFEGNADDSSGNGNNGEEFGGVSYVDGVIGQAASFDGVDDFIMVSDNDLVYDTITINAWVKADRINISTGQHIVSRYEDNEQSYELYLPPYENRIRYKLAHSLNNENNIVLDVGAIDVGVWTMVTLIYDIEQETFSGWQDGELLFSESYSKTINKASLPFIVGASRSGDRYFLDGTIDELRIYDRALSAEEVQALHELGNVTDVTNGLVAHYEFEGNADDSSGNGNNGEEFGGVSYVDGVIGQAASFDGVDDFIMVSDNDLVYDTITINAWVKADRINISTGQHIVSRYEDNEQSYELYLPPYENRIRYKLAHSLNNENNIVLDVGAIDVGVWTMVTLIYDIEQETFSGWQDGELLFSESYSKTINKASLPFIVGASRSGDRYFLDGTIDELRIYDRALSAEEVQALHELGNVTDVTNGLVAHYEFEGNADDSSGNGNNGEEFGGVSYVDGVIGQAVSFDGVDDYIDVAHNDSLSPDILTVSVWVNIIEDNGIVNMLLKGRWNGDLTNNQREYQLNTTYGNFYGEQWNNVYLLNPAVESEWSLITLTYDKNSLLIYKNGLLDNSETFDDEINKPSNPESLTIGSAFGVENGDLGTYQNALNAKMDDFRIYNRALSAEEVQTLYELGND